MMIYPQKSTLCFPVTKSFRLSTGVVVNLPSEPDPPCAETLEFGLATHGETYFGSTATVSGTLYGVRNYTETDVNIDRTEEGSLEKAGRTEGKECSVFQYELYLSICTGTSAPFVSTLTSATKFGESHG